MDNKTIKSQCCNADVITEALRNDEGDIDRCSKCGEECEVIYHNDKQEDENYMSIVDAVKKIKELGDTILEMDKKPWEPFPKIGE